MQDRRSLHQIAPEDIDVVLLGPVPERMREIAEEKVSHATRLSSRDVLKATVTLRELTNRTSAEPSRAEVTLQIPNAVVRAEADASTPLEAVDRVVDRIERRIADQINRWDDRSRWIGVTGEGEWRRGAMPTERPSFFPRPAEEREVVRRKTFAIEPTAVDEAAYDMEAVGHDFYLFTDAESGRDAVIRRRGDGAYGVSGLPEDAVLPEGVRPEPAPPVLTEAAARRRLDDGGEPFVFFIDGETHQGRVLYRRHDGHYGLITPA